MSRKVLTDVFLVMGETTKNDFSSVGGFGKARVLITFCQDSYKIISDDYVCEGCGAGYSIQDSPKVNGCTFEIETEHANWIDIIKRVIDKSNLRQSVKINGEYYQTNKVNRGRMVRELSFAYVYANKSIQSQNVTIRTGGVWMFDKYSQVNANVFIEIKPEMSRTVLTANRDGLQYKEDCELQDFLNELSADTKSALNDKTRHFKKFVNKDKCFKTKIKKDEIKENAIGNASNQTFNQRISTDEFNQILNQFSNPIETESLPVHQTCPILSSMMILNESNDPKTVQLIKNHYMPENWTNRNATRYQLIRVWFAVCNIVMDELSNYRGNEFGFAVGYCFTDNTDGEGAIAMHTESEGVHYLLLNPIANDLKLKYGVNNRDDYFNLIVLAAHEATHCIETRHNETFSSVFTILTQRVLARRKEIIDAIKEIKE